MDNRLVELFNKRTGGSVNFRGIQFQLYYACNRLLNAWFDGSDPESITLEGLEDIDENCKLQIGTTEYVQLKTSQNKMTASDFWNTNVIQNFYQTYLLNPAARFKLVYNMEMAKGSLSDWVKKGKIEAYWLEKLDSIFPGKTKEEWLRFLNQIQFEQHSIKTLKENSELALYKYFGINVGVEVQYFASLLYYAIDWSKNRNAVTKNDLLGVLQNVKDTFSTHDKNPALANGWITEVDFSISEKGDDFFYDGAAAKPHHITKDLPARRREWETEIHRMFEFTDVVVIQSSSGQGKSTLAWRVAYNLFLEHYTTYQLNSCQSRDESVAIADFLQTRIKIGIFPVVVIDNLDLQKSAWKQLVELISLFPIKFIVTSRQEDWYRYGADLSKVNLKTVDLKMKMNEAQDIYYQLKSKGRLHNSIKNWQEPWEAVAEKGLLIEYVYLLTQGDMLRNRLNSQIKSLTIEPDSQCIIEILRIVSVANSMGIVLKTALLSRLIQDEIGFVTDRGEIFKRLEKEYHVKYGPQHIEGLHPVRSRHLVGILHEYVPLSETILKLFNIIEPECHQVFFSEFQNIAIENEVDALFESLSCKISKRSYAEMADAMKGLMEIESRQYLELNKEIFDRAFKRGGLDIFILNTLPFGNNDFLINIGNSLPGEMRENIDELIHLHESLSKVDFKSSLLYKFATCLKKNIALRQNVTDIQGLSELHNWFDQLGIDLPIDLHFDYDIILEQMKSGELSLDDIKELFNYCRRQNPVLHNAFVVENKQHILSWLRLKLQLLYVTESDGDIEIGYIIQENGKNANTQSVQKIKDVFGVLNGYFHYKTDGFVFPFPVEDLYKVIKEEAKKRLSQEVIAPTINPILNIVWVSQLELPYRCASAFEWQQENLKFREKALAFMKYCTLLFEAHLEHDEDKLKRILNNVVDSTNEVTSFFSTKRKSPRFLGNLSQVILSEKATNDWGASLTNFARQFSGIFNRNRKSAAEAGRLPLYNLKEAAEKVSEMQKEYDSNVQNTFPYYLADDLKEYEAEWISRLVSTVELYIENADQAIPSSVANARREILDWKESKRSKRLLQLKTILEENSVGKSYSFIAPDAINDIGNFMEVSIGVRGTVSETPGEFVDLCISLKDLIKTGIEYFYFVFLKDDNKAYNAIRISKGYLENMQDAISGKEPRNSNALPLPVELNERVLTGLSGITTLKLTLRTGDILYKIFDNIWSHLQYRLNVKCENEIDQIYLNSLESSFKREYSKQILDLRAHLEESDFVEMKDFLDKVIYDPPLNFEKVLLAQLHQYLNRQFP